MQPKMQKRYRRVFINKRYFDFLASMCGSAGAGGGECNLLIAIYTKVCWHQEH